MLLLLRIKGNAGITATHARCLAQPQHSGQQLRSCLLSQPRLEGMAPKVKKADKTEAAAKAKAAANKKKDQANMVTQLKAGRKRLQEAKEAGTDLPPAELEDLERRDSFLSSGSTKPLGCATHAKQTCCSSGKNCTRPDSVATSSIKQ